MTFKTLLSLLLVSGSVSNVMGRWLTMSISLHSMAHQTSRDGQKPAIVLYVSLISWREKFSYMF